MKKISYYITNNEIIKGERVIQARKVEGYEVCISVEDVLMRFGIRKDNKSWTVDELLSGTNVNPGHKFATRKEALEYVSGEGDRQTGKKLAEMMAPFANGNKATTFNAHRDAFAKLCEVGEMPSKEYMNMLKPKPEVKPEPPKRKRKQSAAKPKPAPAPKPEPVEQVATAVTLANIERLATEYGKRMEAHEGYTVKLHDVKRSDKELRGQLRALGFKPKKSNNRVWWTAYPTA